MELWVTVAHSNTRGNLMKVDESLWKLMNVYESWVNRINCPNCLNCPNYPNCPNWSSFPNCPNCPIDQNLGSHRIPRESLISLGSHKGSLISLERHHIVIQSPCRVLTQPLHDPYTVLTQFLQSLTGPYRALQGLTAVSYTHLTLPTILLV